MVAVDLTTVEDVMEWVKEIIPHLKKVEDYIQDAEMVKDGTIGGFSLFTDNQRYRISVRCKEGEEGYLGCITTSRKPEAGEDWNRGNDLPDGPLNRNTWNDIIKAIVSYELVPLSKHIKMDQRRKNRSKKKSAIHVEEK